MRTEVDGNPIPNYRWHFLTLGMSIVDASISPSTATLKSATRRKCGSGDLDLIATCRVLTGPAKWSAMIIDSMFLEMTRAPSSPNWRLAQVPVTSGVATLALS